VETAAETMSRITARTESGTVVTGTVAESASTEKDSGRPVLAVRR
jgi:hypothetical protein